MLVLTRRKGQSIIIGDGIEISVEDVNGDAVRIGIRAPKEVSVYRRELYDAIREENISAARTAGAAAAQELKKLQTPPRKKEKEEKQSFRKSAE
jgi:carbon storage regulator